MKVLMILNGISKEGVAMIAVSYTEGFIGSDVRIDLAAAGPCDNEFVNELRKEGLTIYNLPSRINRVFDYGHSLINLLKKNKYDAVHVHGNSSTMAIDLFFGWLGGCKVRIPHCHNTKCNNKLLNNVLRPFLFLLSTEKFACGYDAGKWLYGNKNFIVIQNGREFDKYKFKIENRKNLRSILNIKDNELLIGHVGTLTYQKNQKRLLELLNKLNSQEKNKYKLVLIGEGPDRKELENFINQNNLKNYVILTGNISNVNEYLSAFDIMILPSRYEGLPLVVVEWQMNGLPCLISDCVTKDCKILDNIDFISLDISDEIWIEKIKKLANVGRINDENYIKTQIKDSGFDIKENQIKLKKLYLNNVNKNL